MGGGGRRCGTDVGKWVVTLVMAKKTTLLTVLLLVAMCILVIMAPVAYIAYQNYQSYQTDLNTLTSIATRLGYTPERKLNFYEARAQTYHIMGLAFHVQDSSDQFLVKVQSLGFTLKNFTREDLDRNRRELFLEYSVNQGLRDKFVTLNGRYKSEEFGVEFPPPLVSNWNLYSSEMQRTIEIEYGRPPNSADIWLYDGKPLGGNVVVVTLHRP